MRRRTRIAAIVAAIGVLAGVAVTGGSMAAHADDGLEFASELSDAVVPYAPITFSGTSDEASIPVTVFEGGEFEVCQATVVDGQWSCTSGIPFTPGIHSFQAIQNDPDAEPPIYQIDRVDITVRLPVPFATAPTAIPYGGTMSFTGWNAYPGANIHVQVTDPADTSLLCDTGPIGTFGSWNCPIATDAEIPPGTTATVTFTQTLEGSDPEVGSIEVYVGQVPPAELRLDSPTNDQFLVWSSGAFLPVNGGAPLDAGLPVDVDIDGAPLCSGATVDVDGHWDCGSVVVPWIGADTFGPRVITATQGSATDSATISLAVPGPDDDFPYFADAGTTALSVGDDAGLEGFVVFSQVRDHPEISCASLVSTGGFWSCTLDVSSLPVGTYTVDSHQRPSPDPGNDVQSLISEAALYIETPLTPPTVGCVFRPAGVTVTPSAGVIADYYPVTGGEGSSISTLGPCGGRAGNTPTYVGGFGEPTSCTPQCVLSNLAPGLHNIYYSRSDGEGEGGGEGGFGWFDYYFTVPEAPVITSAAPESGLILLTGTGTPGDDLQVDAVGGGTLCTSSVNGSGAWTCAFPKSAAAAVRAVDIDRVSRGMSAYSASVSVPVAITPVGPAPLPTLSLISWSLGFGDGLDNLQPGDIFTITSDGLPAGTAVEVWMHSTPVLLDSVVATGGPMTFTLTVPLDIEAGAHRVEVIATAPDGTVLTHDEPANVHIVPAKATPGSDEIADHHGNEKNDLLGGTGGGDRNQPAAPTALTDSIPTFQRIGENPVALAFAAGLAIALLFLIALPTELLNASLSSNSSRLGRGFRAVEGAMDRARDWLVHVTHSRAIAAALIVLLVSITFGFIDPAFGFDLASVRLVLSLAIAFFVLSYGASWVSGLIVRRSWGAESVIALQPSIVLFAIVGVVIARLLDFSPGFLVGVAIGLELVRASRKAALGAVLVQFGMIVGLSLAAWIGYSLLTLGGAPTDFGGALLRDALVAIPAEGLMGAMVAIFPLRFLEGREIFEESKLLWALAFLVVATPFALLVLPTALEGTEVSDIGTWLLVFAVFGAVSLAVWWILARADKRSAAEEAEPERESVDA